MSIDVDQLKKDVEGCWLGIYDNLGINYPKPPGEHGPCPVCQGTDRFRLDKDAHTNGGWICGQCEKMAGDGWALVQRVLGMNFMEAVHRVYEIMGGVEKCEPPDCADKPDPAIRLKELSGKSKPLDGSDLASRYLRSRGLVVKVGNLRYCEKCYDPETKREHPAMLSVIQDHAGAYIGIHRTYLDPAGGKAKILSPRKQMPPKKPLAGSAVRLFPASDTVGVAEGVETAMAASILFDMPVWSCIDAGILESFRPPDGVKKVVIFGDNDASFTGQKSAYRLANTLWRKPYECIVDVQIPDNPGDDWNDVLLAKVQK